jgi:hypothetical protein
MAKEYNCLVELHFVGNSFEANNIEEYKQKVRDSFDQEFGVMLGEDDISCIEEVV